MAGGGNELLPYQTMNDGGIGSIINSGADREGAVFKKKQKQ